MIESVSNKTALPFKAGALANFVHLIIKESNEEVI